jgi:hypothetical protein
MSTLDPTAGASLDVIMECYVHLTKDDAYDAMMRALQKARHADVGGPIGKDSASRFRGLRFSAPPAGLSAAAGRSAGTRCPDTLVPRCCGTLKPTPTYEDD